MAGPFTKARRQAIVREFAVRHNGNFNPKLFLEEVRARGNVHPAYFWFEWDLNRAAYQHQLTQAREFASDLRVSFKIETVGRLTPIVVREDRMPMVLSPMAGRRDGGGYVLVDPKNPDHVDEHCRQAAAALRAWLDRYSSALVRAGGTVEEMLALIELLDTADARKAA